MPLEEEFKKNSLLFISFFMIELLEEKEKIDVSRNV